MEKDLKEIITKRVQAKLEKEQAYQEQFDFKEISYKRKDNFIFVHHPKYAEKNIEFFNDEENTDFLVFEKNNVFIDYSDNLFNFHKIGEDDKLLEVDLDNQEIIEHKQMEVDEEDLSEEIVRKTDLVTLNYFPLCMSHCYLTLCYEQDLPQVLSSEFIIQLLQIFTLTMNNSLRCGYDSLGAGCLINHLHFEFLMLDDMPDNVTELPIESASREKIFTTKLKHKNEDEIQLFDENVTITGYVISHPVRCWVLEASENFSSHVNSIACTGYQNSIAQVATFIFEKLISAEIPHNLIISNSGKTFYIIPRNFDSKEFPINTCWNDLAGIMTFRSKSDYENFTADDVAGLLKEKVGLNETDFSSLTEQLLSEFASIYITDKL